MEFVFWFVAACIACYVAGVKRRSAVDRDEELMRLESRALTAEGNASVSAENAVAWKAACQDAERELGEAKGRLARVSGAFREQVIANGEVLDVIRRLHVSEFSRN